MSPSLYVSIREIIFLSVHIYKLAMGIRLARDLDICQWIIQLLLSRSVHCEHGVLHAGIIGALCTAFTRLSRQDSDVSAAPRLSQHLRGPTWLQTQAPGDS